MSPIDGYLLLYKQQACTQKSRKCAYTFISICIHMQAFSPTCGTANAQPSSHAHHAPRHGQPPQVHASSHSSTPQNGRIPGPKIIEASPNTESAQDVAGTHAPYAPSGSPSVSDGGLLRHSTLASVHDSGSADSSKQAAADRLCAHHGHHAHINGDHVAPWSNVRAHVREGIHVRTSAVAGEDAAHRIVGEVFFTCRCVCVCVFVACVM